MRLITRAETNRPSGDRVEVVCRDDKKHHRQRLEKIADIRRLVGEGWYPLFRAVPSPGLLDEDFRIGETEALGFLQALNRFDLSTIAYRIQYFGRQFFFCNDDFRLHLKRGGKT